MNPLVTDNLVRKARSYPVHRIPELWLSDHFAPLMPSVVTCRFPGPNKTLTCGATQGLLSLTGMWPSRGLNDLLTEEKSVLKLGEIACLGRICFLLCFMSKLTALINNFKALPWWILCHCKCCIVFSHYVHRGDR